MTDRMMQFFAYSHLPPHLQEISKPFGDMAQQIVDDALGGKAYYLGKLELAGKKSPFAVTGTLHFAVSGLRAHAPDSVQKLELNVTTHGVHESL